MMRLKSYNTAPPGGFIFIDKATGFRVHGWSLGAAAAQWYQEQMRRGVKTTIENCRAEVESFTCGELMKSPGWDQWVIVTTPKPPFIPTSLFHQKDVSVSVVIPVYKRTERLEKVKHTVSGQCDEVFVVDGDGLGFGANCNFGASKTKSAFIWFLNDDCYPDKSCAEHLKNVLLANPKIGAVGHLLRYPSGYIQHGGTQRVKGQVGFPHRDLGLLHPSLKVPTEMEAVTAASVMVRREAFEAVGGFDEGYDLYLEDSDLCLKLRQAGWKVYFTPFAEAVHEEHASSKNLPNLNQIIQYSVSRFTQKWEQYFRDNPDTPTFEAFESVTQTPSIDTLYVHPVGSALTDAKRFVDSVVSHPPGQPINWVIACNSPSGDMPSDAVKSLFSKLGNVQYFSHDNSGWDIGAFQAYSKVCKSDVCLFLGSSAYCRQENWAQRMMMAYRLYGPNAIYGVTGNMGNAACGVSPHLRTTGFWCKPEILRQYPHIVTRPEERYPFEHGPHCLTMWAWSQGYQVYVVETQSVFAFPDWDNGPEGFHRGTQKHVIFGDRVCAQPYFPHP